MKNKPKPDITINCFTREVVYDSGLKIPSDWLAKHVVAPYINECEARKEKAKCN